MGYHNPLLPRLHVKLCFDFLCKYTTQKLVDCICNTGFIEIKYISDFSLFIKLYNFYTSDRKVTAKKGARTAIFVVTH